MRSLVLGAVAVAEVTQVTFLSCASGPVTCDEYAVTWHAVAALPPVEVRLKACFCDHVPSRVW